MNCYILVSGRKRVAKNNRQLEYLCSWDSYDPCESSWKLDCVIEGFPDKSTRRDFKREIRPFLRSCPPITIRSLIQKMVAEKGFSCRFV